MNTTLSRSNERLRYEHCAFDELYEALDGAELKSYWSAYKMVEQYFERIRKTIPQDIFVFNHRLMFAASAPVITALNHDFAISPREDKDIIMLVMAFDPVYIADDRLINVSVTRGFVFERLAARGNVYGRPLEDVAWLGSNYRELAPYVEVIRQRGSLDMRFVRSLLEYQPVLGEGVL